MTEVRRDGKDDAVIEKIICAEFNRRLALPKLKKSKFIRRYTGCLILKCNFLEAYCNQTVRHFDLQL